MQISKEIFNFVVYEEPYDSWKGQDSSPFIHKKIGNDETLLLEILFNMGNFITAEAPPS